MSSFKKKNTNQDTTAEASSPALELPAGTVASMGEAKCRFWMHSMNQITPNVYLGGIGAAMDVQNLRRFQISLVITILEKALLPPKTLEEYRRYAIEHWHIEKRDSPGEDLKPFFTEAYHRIDDAVRKGRGVLVHCRMGISRSATIVLAYVMQLRRLKFDKALQQVRQKRSVASPNEGFRGQLRAWNRET